MEHKKFKYSFEPQFSTGLYNDLMGLAQRIVTLFTQEVKPVLTLFGLHSDEYIRKCFHLESMEEIYKNAMEKNATRIGLLEDIAAAKGEDFWEPLRDEDSEAKKPTEEGFVFRKIPWADNPTWMIDKVCKAGLTVDNCKFHIDENAIKAESMFYPTDRMRELLDLATDFCETVNAMNLKRKNVLSWLFVENDNKIKPNPKGIVFGNKAFT